MKTKLLILLGLSFLIEHLYAQVEIKPYEDRPDSVIFLVGKKDSYRCDSYQLFRYDEIGRVSSVEAFNNRNDGVNFLPAIRVEQIYDPAGYLSARIEYVWGGDKKRWVPSEKEESKYDASGRLTFNSTSEWDQSLNDWICDGKYELFTIDEAIIENVYSYWNKETKDWSNKSFRKSELHKDSSGEIIYTESFFTKYYDDLWGGNKKTENYNKNKQCVLSINKSWFQESFDGEWADPDYSQCESASKSESTYENDLQLANIKYEWDLDQNRWLETEQRLYEYDEQGICKKSYYNLWNPAINDWGKQGYSDYSMRGDTVVGIGYGWHTEKESWELTGKSERCEDQFRNLVWNLYWSWDSTKECWEAISKHESVFDKKNRMLFEASYVMRNNNIFQGTYRTIKRYDDFDNQIFSSSSQGILAEEEPEGWTWYVDMQEEVLYDDQNNPSAYLLSYDNERRVDRGEYIYDAQGRLEKIVADISSNEGNWIDTTLYFYNHSSGLNPVQQSDGFKIVSEGLTVSVQPIGAAVVEVYNLSGMRIASGINCVNVPARGLYIVNVNGKAHKIMVSGK